MKKNNLVDHIKGHAAYIYQNNKLNDSALMHAYQNNETLHFTVSLLDLDFYAQHLDTVEIMKSILIDLLKSTYYLEKNGYRQTRKEKRQKYAHRAMELESSAYLIAIHVIGAEGEATHPHFHFILNKKARFGVQYSLLKSHINTIVAKYKLIPNFAEPVFYNRALIKNLQKSVKKFAWAIKTNSSTNAAFRKMLGLKIDRQLTLLIRLTLHTQNTLFYIKVMETIRKRCALLRINYSFENHNLRYSFPILRTQRDEEAIKVIKEKKYTQKTMISVISSEIMRDFIRFSLGRESLFIDAVRRYTNELKGVQGNKKAVNIFNKLRSQYVVDVIKNTKITAHFTGNTDGDIQFYTPRNNIENNQKIINLSKRNKRDEYNKHKEKQRYESIRAIKNDLSSFAGTEQEINDNLEIAQRCFRESDNVEDRYGVASRKQSRTSNKNDIHFRSVLEEVEQVRLRKEYENYFATFIGVVIRIITKVKPKIEALNIEKKVSPK